MKKLFAIFTLVLAAIANINAYDFEYLGLYYNLDSANKTAYLTNDNGYGYQQRYIKIPEKVTFGNREIRVIGISAYTFYACHNLVSVSIPNSITTIGKEAFSFCDHLKSIEIPNSVREIGESAFDHCTNLTSVKLPDNLKRIRYNLFSFCKNLQSIKIPNSVTTIEMGAFSRCESLGSIEFPPSVNNIDISAFANCSSLNEVFIPKTVKNLSSSAFKDCENITSFYILDESDSSNQLNLIGKVIYLKSLKNLYIGRNVKGEGFIADNLENLILGRFVTNFEIGLGTSSKDMYSIYSWNPTPPPFYFNFSDIEYATMNITVLPGSVSTYKSAPNWRSFWNIHSIVPQQPEIADGIYYIRPLKSNKLRMDCAMSRIHLAYNQDNFNQRFLIQAVKKNPGAVLIKYTGPESLSGPSGLFFDNEQNMAKNNNSIILHFPSGNNQNWYLDKVSKDTYVIRNVEYPSFCLQVANNSINDDVSIVLAPYTGNDSQKWVFVPYKP